jgi:hypothetical protein
VIPLTSPDGEEDAPDERQQAGLDGRWDGVDDADSGGDADHEADLEQADGAEGVPAGRGVQRPDGGRLGGGVDREDGRPGEAEGGVGGVDGREDDPLEAAVKGHGAQRRVRAGATVREGVAAHERDGARPDDEADGRAARHLVDGEEYGESPEREQQDGDGLARTGSSADDREDETAAEEAGDDGRGDDGKEVDADDATGRPVGGDRHREKRRAEGGGDESAATTATVSAAERTDRIAKHGTEG